jgi:hypothetical protein
MGKAETIRVKMRVKTGGYRAGQVVDVRKGLAEQFIKVGYATRLDSLADAFSAEPTKYGDWVDDPRSTADTPEFPEPSDG